MRRLYYIDSINQNQFVAGERNAHSTYTLRLEDVGLAKEFYDQRENRIDEHNILSDGVIKILSNMPLHALTLAGSNTQVYEGMFVYYDEQNGEFGSFSAGWRDPDAQMLIAEGRTARKHLRTIIENRENHLQDIAWMSNSNVKVYSYHVNVGHGNCSLVLWHWDGKYQLWMVDCGHSCISDSIVKTNIRKIFAEIEGMCGMPIHIHRFLLTHWHDDHFCDVQYLIEQGWIDSTTEFVMNLYYQCSSAIAVPLLKILDNMHVHCYEPLVQYSTYNMHILYPSQTIVRWPNFAFPCVAEKAINNSSVVFSIHGASKNIVFPGDLEKKGFDRMTNAHTCRCDLCTSSYYCVSHHASKTGHINMSCRGNGPYPSVFDCVNHNLDCAIIMGKNHAYPGVYSPIVINAPWKCPLLYSEHDNQGRLIRAVCVDWSNGTPSYIY